MPIVERTFYVSASREAMVDHADQLGIDWKWFRHGLCELEVTGTVDTDSEKPDVKITRIEYGKQVLVQQGPPAVGLTEANVREAVLSARQKDGSIILSAYDDKKGLVAPIVKAIMALHEPPCPKCGGRGWLECDDPQCSDSTWDHACTAGATCDKCGGKKVALHEPPRVTSAQLTLWYSKASEEPLDAWKALVRNQAEAAGVQVVDDEEVGDAE